MILLGLGSNLPSSYGDRFKNIDLAISALNGYGIQVKKKSSYYESLSYPNKENPNNAPINSLSSWSLNTLAKLIM